MGSAYVSALWFSRVKSDSKPEEVSLPCIAQPGSSLQIEGWAAEVSVPELSAHRSFFTAPKEHFTPR